MHRGLNYDMGEALYVSCSCVKPTSAMTNVSNLRAHICVKLTSGMTNFIEAYVLFAFECQV